MFNKIKQIILNRNAILVLAVVAGIAIGDNAAHIKFLAFPALALTMTFSMTGIQTSHLRDYKHIYKPILAGILLNYILFTAVILVLAWWLMPTPELFYGFVVIAAAPPGVAIIPFSYILKGDAIYAIISVVSAFLASIFIAPIFVRIFASTTGVNSTDLFIMMLQLVVVPLIISRLLLWKKIYTRFIVPIRGKVVDYGFALLIFIAVGLNREVFFSSPDILLKVGLAILVTIFGLGHLVNYIGTKLKTNQPELLTQTMLVGIKSSGFSVFTAITLFGKEAAIPSAVFAVVVLIYLIFLSIKAKVTK